MALLYARASNGCLASIPVNIMGFTQSLASNAWQKLPSGLIIQWGLTAEPYLESTRAEFPVSFSNANYAIVGIPQIHVRDDNYTHTLGVLFDEGNKTNTFCLFRISATSSPADYYLAIGT